MPNVLRTCPQLVLVSLKPRSPRLLLDPRLNVIPQSRTSFQLKGHNARSFFSGLPRLARAPPELLLLKSLEGENDHKLARVWLADFDRNDIPKTSYEVTYSRSSGPGGQNVNKTNSKASVRMPLPPAIGSWLPWFIFPPLTKSPHFLSDPPALLISSQTSRSAPENLDKALTLLYETLVEASKACVRGETSPEQKERVRQLKQKDQARRRQMKERQSKDKAWRRGE